MCILLVTHFASVDAEVSCSSLIVNDDQERATADTSNS